MTWWDALGLALALYGVVVLLEWGYDQILGLHSRKALPLSVVVRVTNQEGQVELAVRELVRYFGQRQWERRAIDVVLWDTGSRDQTEQIVGRLDGNGWFRVVSAPNADDVLQFCRHPLVVWMDCNQVSRSDGWIADLDLVRRKSAAE